MFRLSQIEKLQKIIKDIGDTLIIVEGIKDKRALSKLGFKNVLAISGKSIFFLVEKIKSKKVKSVVVLTDFDKEGEKKFKILSRILQSNKIKTNYFIRRKIKTLFNIYKIEEFNSLVKLIENNYNFDKTHKIAKKRRIRYKQSRKK